MVQVIQRNRTPAEIAAESLGQGIAGGLSGAIEGFQRQQQQTTTAAALGSFAGFDEKKTKLLGMLPVELQQYVVDKHVARGKERSSLSKMLKSELSNYKDEDFTGEDYNEIRNRARELFDEGMDAEQAIEQATQSHLARPSSKQGVSKTLRNLQESTGITPQGLNQFGEDIKGGALKAVRPWYELQTQMGPQFDPLHPGRGTPIQQFDVATEGKGKPSNIVEEIVAGYPFGPEGLAFNYGEKALEGAPEPIRMAAGFIAAVGAHKAANSPIFKVGSKVIEKAHNKAQVSGQKIEDVIAKAQKDSGADLAKAAQGDAAEINKLNRAITKEVPEVGKKVEAAPKEFAQPEKEISRRERVGEKLKERPLEEYYKPEKAVEHKPATIVKQEEVRQRVQPLLNEKTKELSQAERDLSQLKESRKRVPEESKGRIEAGIKHAEDIQIPRLKQHIEDLKYELKNFRKAPTPEEIQAEVTKSGKVFIEEAKNPTEAGQKKIEAQIEKDKAYIERAAKLAEKGKLEGEIKPDTFIKMKQAYLDGYNALIGELREELRSLKGARDQEGLKAIADRRQAIRHLETRKARLMADIQNQTDKLKVKGHLEKPSGAFYKQQLRTARADVEAFQKDFIKEHKHRIEPGERKADLVARKELAKTIQETRKNPTFENISKIAEEAGVPKHEVKTIESQVKEGIKEGKSIKDLTQEVGKKWETLGEKVKDGIKKKTGSNTLANKLAKRWLGATGLTYIVSLLISKGEHLTPSQVFKSYKSSSEIEDYREALQSGDREKIREIRRKFIGKGYSAAKINTIAKAAKAKERSNE